MNKEPKVLHVNTDLILLKMLFIINVNLLHLKLGNSNSLTY